MSRLDWAKGGLYEPDPARAQQYRDFVEPDRVITVIRDLTPEEKRELARREARRRQAHRRKRSSAKKAKPIKKPALVKAKQKQIDKKPLTPEESLAAEVRRVARAERRRAAKAALHQQYLSKARRQQAVMAAKKKTHLEAWAEKQQGVRADRESLHRVWRAKLLPDADMKPSSG